jgi:hypothetical protein
MGRFRGAGGGKRCKNAIKLVQSGINLGGICYFLNTTVSFWSLELTCFDAGQGELQTPRQSQAIHSSIPSDSPKEFPKYYEKIQTRINLA